MKKIVALILTLALAFALATVPAFAATIQSESHEVTATYLAGDSSNPVYSVNLAWGAMDFTYTDGAWNPNTHSYDTSDASWSATGNTVTVTNHSNAAVTATLAYNAEPNYKGITGLFKENSETANDGVLKLATAVGTAVENAPAQTAALSLSGVLNSKTPAGTTIGTVTVTLD